MGDEPFSILSIAGGGVRGICVAAVLDRLERDVGARIADHFDLVVGTSTGGIIALGLGAGLSPGEILEFYVQHMATIFPARRRHPLVLPLALLRSKYRPDGLQDVLQDVFGDGLLGDSQMPLVIPSYNVGANSVYLFKTPHHDRLRRDWRVPMWQVALAPTAAPRVFPAYSLPGAHLPFVARGVWADKPALWGLAAPRSM